MHSDAYFTIGKGHNVCQDYALCKENAIFISDGCSSSENTDIGARILPHLVESVTQFRDPDKMLKMMQIARGIANSMGLSSSCLDATLLSCVSVDTLLATTFFGDGVAALRKRDGSIIIRSVELPENAPPYLSYSISPHRAEVYNKDKRTVEIVETKNGIIELEMEFPVQPFLRPITFTDGLQDLDAVFLFSDGIKSFTETNNLGAVIPVSYERVLSELLAIKGYAGEFVKRRAKSFLNNFCKEKGWIHHDDFSMAGLYLK